jgi:hypothetical protein
MREMAAIEALKSEKADKEVCVNDSFQDDSSHSLLLTTARTAATHRHFRRVRTSKVACLRRLWRVPLRA